MSMSGARPGMPSTPPFRERMRQIYGNSPGPSNSPAPSFPSGSAPHSNFTPSKSGNKANPGILPKAPKAPEKPLMPYMRFSRKVWDSVKSKNPEMRLWQIGKVIGQMWRELTDVERKEYNDGYESDKVQYQENLKVYHNSPQYQSFLREKQRAEQILEEEERRSKSAAASAVNEHRVSIQPADYEAPEDASLSVKNVASARYHRNHALINEIFSEALVPDGRSVVTESRMTLLRKQVRSLMEHQQKLEKELGDITDKFTTKKRKFVESSEEFGMRLKEECDNKPAMTSARFDALVLKHKAELRIKYEKMAEQQKQQQERAMAAQATVQQHIKQQKALLQQQQQAQAPQLHAAPLPNTQQQAASLPNTQQQAASLPNTQQQAASQQMHQFVQQQPLSRVPQQKPQYTHPQHTPQQVHMSAQQSFVSPHPQHSSTQQPVVPQLPLPQTQNGPQQMSRVPSSVAPQSQIPAYNPGYTPVSEPPNPAVVSNSAYPPQPMSQLPPRVQLPPQMQQLPPHGQQPPLQAQQLPPHGQQPPLQTQQLPPHGQQPPLQAQQLPSHGQQPPLQTQQLPPHGQQPPLQAHQLPPHGQQPPFQSQQLPPQAQLTPSQTQQLSMQGHETQPPQSQHLPPQSQLAPPQVQQLLPAKGQQTQALPPQAQPLRPQAHKQQTPSQPLPLQEQQPQLPPHVQLPPQLQQLPPTYMLQAQQLPQHMQHQQGAYPQHHIGSTISLAQSKADCPKGEPMEQDDGTATPGGGGGSETREDPASSYPGVQVTDQNMDATAASGSANSSDINPTDGAEAVSDQILPAAVSKDTPLAATEDRSTADIRLSTDACPSTDDCSPTDSRLAGEGASAAE